MSDRAGKEPKPVNNLRASSKVERPVSPFRLGLRRLTRGRMAMLGLVTLGVLYFCALFADFLAPYSFDNQARALSYCPPNLRFVDAAGHFHPRPFVYRRGYAFDENTGKRVWHEDRTKRYPISLFVRGDKHRLLWLVPTTIRLFGAGEAVPDTGQPLPSGTIVQRAPGPSTPAPPRVYLIGATDQGEDVFSRLLYGARISMTVGLVGSAITFILGMLVGGISGYYGGIVDTGIQRLCEMMMMIPGFYLMLALRAAMPPNMSSTRIYIFVVAILSFIGWAGFARVIRGIVLSIRNKEYVTAARAAGVRSLTIITRHVLPNTLSYAIISVTLGIPGYIIGESALSLLGLGIMPPQASWGNMLSAAMNISEIQFHPWVLVPGALIFIAVMSFNLVGDGLRDAFDPQGLTRKAARP